MSFLCTALVWSSLADLLMVCFDGSPNRTEGLLGSKTVSELSTRTLSVLQLNHAIVSNRRLELSVIYSKWVRKISPNYDSQLNPNYSTFAAPGSFH